MMAFLAGICVGVILLAALAFGVSAWMLHHLTAEEAGTLVIDGQAYENDR